MPKPARMCVVIFIPVYVGAWKDQCSIGKQKCARPMKENFSMAASFVIQAEARLTCIWMYLLVICYMCRHAVCSTTTLLDDQQKRMPVLLSAHIYRHSEPTAVGL